MSNPQAAPDWWTQTPDGNPHYHRMPCLSEHLIQNRMLQIATQMDDAIKAANDDWVKMMLESIRDQIVALSCDIYDHVVEGGET